MLKHGTTSKGWIKMKTRWLGSKIPVSALGLGCMGLSHAFGTPLAKKEAADKVRAAFDMGYSFFDTAECYTGTNPDGTTAYNEEAVGLGIKGIRDKIVLATKCGVIHSYDGLTMDSRPEAIRRSVEGSLKRLGTDYIDLYYQHRMDPKVEPEVVAETMAALIKEGKIRAWGISCPGKEYLRRANAVCPVTAVQNMYNMIDRGTEELFPLFEEFGITLVAYTPLAKGFLSGTYLERPTFDNPEDNRSGRFQFSEEGFGYYQDALKLIRETAESKNATMAQISLAWILAQKPWIVPIPGTRTVSRMKENLDAADIELTNEELNAINTALNKLNLCDTSAKRIK